MQKLAVAAFERYCVSNPLHPDVFPAIRKMEAEVVSMCLNMYSNPNGAVRDPLTGLRGKLILKRHIL
jgi:sphinganine-1-phosphate aldolase